MAENGKVRDAGPGLNGKSMNEYRDVARQKLLPKNYSGYQHLLSLFAGCIAVFVATVYIMEPIRWWDIAAVPLFFMLSNVSEYVVHRYPMHRIMTGPLCRMYFRSHTGLHHKFYTYGYMQPDLGHRDWYFTLFPLRFYAIWFLMGTVPMMVIGPFFLPRNVCLVMACVVSSYLFLYEVMHSFSHSSLPPPVLKVLALVPGMLFTKRHHRLHHHPRLMTSKNFNLTLPLTDWLVGTLVTRLPD